VLLSVLMNTKLDVLAKGLVELVEIVLVFRNLAEKIKRLLDNTLDEVEILGNDIFTVIHNENSANVKLDVIALFRRLEDEGSALGDEEMALNSS
jgi:hypothetical protein